MTHEQEFKKSILNIFLILIVGGIGGILLDRLVLPYLSTISLFKNLPILSPRTPLVITRREEIRIQEGINNLEVVNRIRNTLVTVYLHEGEFGAPKFRLLGIVSGVFVSSDGIIAVPGVNLRPDASLTAILNDQEVFRARMVGIDSFTGMAFLKIDRVNLPVIKQGFSEELKSGERVLLIKPAETVQDVLVIPATVSGETIASASLFKTYDFNRLNSFLSTDLSSGFFQGGAIVVNRDAALVGFVTEIGKDTVIIRSEDLKLAIDNLLDDQKIVWPSLKLIYQILAEPQTKLFRLPKKNGILIKSAFSPLRENDFIYEINGQELRRGEDIQTILLRKKPGEVINFKLIRSQKEMEVQVSLGSN